MFDPPLRELMEQYTENPRGDGWFGPWNTILLTLFPISQGYIVTPHRRAPEPDSHLIIEVVKMTKAPFTLRAVLLIAIGSAHHLKSGIPVPERQLNEQINIAFAADTTLSKVYWIESIGPYWRYGQKEDNGQDVQPLIEWHDTTHDQASIDDFQTLKRLVAVL